MAAASAAAAALSSLYQQRLSSTNNNNNTYSITAGGPIRPTAALHAARIVQRPLGRTQSAPLPLGHPALLSGGSSSSGQSSIKQPQTTSSLVKQHIRNAVLTRASSKGQMVENVEEETEAAVAAEALMQDNDQSNQTLKKTKGNPEDISDQVIDLTNKRSANEEKSTSPNTTNIINSATAADIMFPTHLSPFRLTSTTSASNIQQAIQHQQLQQQLQQQQQQYCLPFLGVTNTASIPLPTTPLATYPFIDPTWSAFYQRAAAVTGGTCGGNYLQTTTGNSAFRSPLLSAGGSSAPTTAQLLMHHHTQNTHFPPHFLHLNH
ncbi:hypothetical protein BLA29_007873, partial [Euroglyphus maynei]